MRELSRRLGQGLETIAHGRIGALICALALVALPQTAVAADPPVAKEFSLTASELQAMVEFLPPDIRAPILAKPGDFLHLVADVLEEPKDYLLLVDKSHALSHTFVPSDLVSLKRYSLSLYLGDVMVRRSIMPAILDMVRAAKNEGIALVFSSGYRSYEYQKYVYEREVKTYGQETADRESARPGASQHQLGTAIDFGSITDEFATTPAGRWLAAHAWEYGFSLSYPQGEEAITGYRYESWHYRYVTKPGTLLQRKYFGDIQQYMMEFLDASWATLMAKRSK